VTETVARKSWECFTRFSRGGKVLAFFYLGLSGMILRDGDSLASKIERGGHFVSLNDGRKSKIPRGWGQETRGPYESQKKVRITCPGARKCKESPGEKGMLETVIAGSKRQKSPVDHSEDVGSKNGKMLPSELSKGRATVCFNKGHRFEKLKKGGMNEEGGVSKPQRFRMNEKMWRCA